MCQSHSIVGGSLSDWHVHPGEGPTCIAASVPVHPKGGGSSERKKDGMIFLKYLA